MTTNIDNLKSIFKPDKYGFCKVEIDGKTHGFWFDTVVKVASLLEAR